MGQKSQMVKRRGTDDRPLAAMLGELRELRKLVQMTERSFREAGSKDPGCGAPTHFHNTADEVIIVLDGALEMWIGDERRIVGANHTVSLPAGVPHGFVAVGPGPTRILAFLPQSGEAVATTYVDGGPPQSANRR